MKAPAQISMRELLQDPLYSAWLEKVPTVNSSSPKPWRLFVLIDGKWKKAEIKKYKKGLKLLRKMSGKVDDIALACKPKSYNPPVVRDKKTGKKSYWRRFPSSHIWCPYCRRPTVFTTFKAHHAIPAYYCTSYEPRCSICGVRLAFLLRPLRGLL